MKHAHRPHVTSSLPKPWEHDETFSDTLYHWMDRAPWLAISFATHLLLYFVLAAIPWSTFERPEPPMILATVFTPSEEIFEEPVVEELVDPVPVEVDDPVLVDTDVQLDQDSDAVDQADVDRPLAPLDRAWSNDAIGIGGGPAGGSGKLGGRGSRRAEDGEYGPQVRAGLDWLADHQSDDGSWSPDAYMFECDGEPPFATGEGNGVHQVGVSALALLAFMGYGDTLSEGHYAETIRRGIGWLRRQQDPESGRLGPASSKEWLYDHALGTLALAEAHFGAPNPLLARHAQLAVDFCVRARADYGAWRYDVPNLGEADTSISGWMVFALGAAKDAGLRVDTRAFEDALSFVDEVTDGAGRTGYTRAGEGSSRPRHLLDVYPARETEALTAVGLLSRVFIAASLGRELAEASGPDPGTSDLIELGVERLVALPPAWPRELLPTPGDLAPEGSGGLDMYYWYYGSYALFQLSDRFPRAWRTWEAALERAALPSQRTSPPCFAGSWDPLGVWGEEGGRVYSTAMMVLCLEVHFRYGKVFGGR